MDNLETVLTKRIDLKLSYALYLVFKKFGFHIKKLFYKFSILLYEYKKACCHCKFLINCRFYDIVPSHIENSIKNLSGLSMHSNKELRNMKKIITKTKKRILNIEIADINVHKKFLLKEIERKKTLLSNLTNTNLMDCFTHFYNTKLIFISKKLEDKLDKKLEMLYTKKYKVKMVKNSYMSDNTSNTQVNVLNHNNSTSNDAPNGVSNNKWLVNLSKVHLPQCDIDTLQLGEKFNFTYNLTEKNTLTIIKNLEYCLNRNTIVDSKFAMNLRNNILSVIEK